MNTIEADGKTYIKAADAARAIGYTADYVGQLCRKGAIDARFVGRSWYVREGELERQKKSKSRTNTEKTIKEMERELEVVEEEKQKIHKSVYVPGVTPEYRKRILETPISYTSEEGESVPTLSRYEEEPDSVEEVPEENDIEDQVVKISVLDSELEETPKVDEIENDTDLSESEEKTLHNTSIYREEDISNLPVKRQSFLPVVAASALGVMLIISSFFLEGSWVYVMKEDARALSTESSFSSTFDLASVTTAIDSLRDMF